MFMLAEKRKCNSKGSIKNRGVNWALASTYKKKVKKENGGTLAYYIVLNNENLPIMVVVGEQIGGLVYNIQKTPLYEVNFTNTNNVNYTFVYEVRHYVIKHRIYRQ